MTPQEAIKALDMIPGGDPEAAHSEAEDVLYALVPIEVREAYDRVVKRQNGRWWYA